MICSSINYINYINQYYYNASTIMYWTNYVEYNTILILVCSYSLSEKFRAENNGNEKYGYY